MALSRWPRHQTRSGAEWGAAEGARGHKIIHLVAPTEADYRDVMVNGPAGLGTSAPPHERPRYVGQHRRVEFPNAQRRARTSSVIIGFMTEQQLSVVPPRRLLSQNQSLEDLERGKVQFRGGEGMVMIPVS